MRLLIAILHQDCAAMIEGRTTQPPKFNVTDFSEDSTQTRLSCAFCGQQLTLTCHTADNPAHPLSPQAPGERDGSHGAERPHELHPPG